MATSTSTGPFTFVDIRRLQKECSDPRSKVQNDPKLKEVSSMIKERQYENALQILNPIIEEQQELAKKFATNTSPPDSSPPSGTFDEDILHSALLLRADTFFEVKNYVRAEDDAQNSILIKPNVIAAYSKLSSIERAMGQIGKAEVALRLGLMLNSEKEEVKSKLSEIRSRDIVFPNVRKYLDPDFDYSLQYEASKSLRPSTSLPPIISAILEGDLQRVKALWTTSMVDFKYGKIDYPLMHFPVLGIQRRANGSLDDYKALVDFLFEQGVRLDARDKFGFTAVLHASDPSGEYSTQPEMLEHLLRKGADPDIKSITGCVALYEPSLKSLNKVVEILLKNEANPHLADIDGETPFSVAVDESLVIYEKYGYSLESDKTCSKANCSASGSKRCAKCRIACYCEKRCQEEDWPRHKIRCNQIHKSHKKLALVGSYQNRLSESERNGIFVVNIEAKMRFNGYDDYGVDSSKFLEVYNETGSFDGQLHSSKLEAINFFAYLRQTHKCGGFFWAYLVKGTSELVVITDPLLPAQSWWRGGNRLNATQATKMVFKR